MTSTGDRIAAGWYDPHPEFAPHERILLVEDDVAIADSIGYSLRAAGYGVDAVDRGEAALETDADRYDLVLLDVVLPGLSGVEVCRRLRERSVVPIVMLTAHNSEVDRVVGLEAGADDYVGKPFAMAELISRVRAILRRRALDRRVQRGAVRQVGGLRLDLATQTAWVEGTQVALTPSEFRLLVMLASEPGKTFTRQEIVDHLGVRRSPNADRACDVHVKNLRRKIEQDPALPRYVVTVRGVGYMLHSP